MIPALPSEGIVTSGRHCFGDIVVDAAAHTLLRAGIPRPVEPKAFAVLLVLLQRPGELIGRDELLDSVWGHRHVTPGVLTRAIAQLRHALDDDVQHPKYIHTQHSVGYRFVGMLEPDPTACESPAAEQARASTEAERTAEIEGGSPATTLPTSHSNPRPLSLRRWIAMSALVAVGCWAVWLQANRAQAPLASEASIAVLPFTTLSDESSDRYFAEGLAVEMHDALAGVPGLQVAAWMSPGAVTEQADPKALGRRLGVAAVLDASVRRTGSRVRINARLSDTATGFTLWSRIYDRDLSDVFATQSDIAQEVVLELVGTVPDEGEGLRRRLAPTRNVAAFDSYLRGVHSLMRGKSADAAGMFRNALKNDSGFARAQAGICRAEISRFEYMRSSVAFDNAMFACKRAEKMDPTIPETKLALGDLHRVRGELGKAQEYYRTVLNEPAAKSKALIGLARVYAEQGNRALSISHYQKALAASPGDAHVYSDIGYEHYLDGRMDDAIASFRKAVELKPTDAILWGTLGALHLAAGNNAEAESALERSNAIEANYAAVSNLGTLKYQTQDYVAAASYYRQAIQLDPGDFYPWGFLGDALIADPKTESQAKSPFSEAAIRAQRYVQVKPEDAKALAALGWYRANLGEQALARDYVSRSEALNTDRGDVALFNAQTLALIGDVAGARQRVDVARKNGVAQTLIASNAILRRAGVISPAGANAQAPARRASEEPSRGG